MESKKVEFFNTTVEGDAGEANKLLNAFAKAGVNLLAFKAVPVSPGRTRFSLFPDKPEKMIEGAKKAGLKLEGPHTAVLVKSISDEPGECAGIFGKLSRAGIHVYEAAGIADIKEGYGVVLYLKPEDCEKAAVALRS
jgi:hypothetical protein